MTLDDARAFKIQLVRKDGKDSDRCIVMGRAEPGRVNLSTGSYLLRLEQLSDGPTQPITKQIEITDETANLNLSYMFPAILDGIADQPITSPRMSEMKQAVRQSRIGPKRSKESNQLRAFEVNFDGSQSSRTPSGLKFESLDRVITKELAIGLSPLRKGLNFEIGLSHNPVSRDIGWLAAEGVNIQFEASSEGTLKLKIEDCSVYDRNGSENHRRIRLTLAIEGRPAIRTPLPLFSGGVLVSIAPLWINDESDALIRIEAIDPKKQALVAALSELNGDEARSIINWTAGEEGDAAMKVLLHKKKDLWAATVAALLLAKTYRLKEVAQWAYNLESFAPHISDAAVAAAWARASDEALDLDLAESKTLRHLKKSRKIGAPTFQITHSIALELLNAIRGTSSDSKRREEARNEMSIWVRRARSRLFKSPYIMWEQAGSQLQKGRLPKQRYLRIAKGRLNQNGFETDFFNYAVTQLVQTPALNFDRDLIAALANYAKGLISKVSGTFEALTAVSHPASPSAIPVRTQRSGNKATAEEPYLDRWMVRGIHSNDKRTTIFLTNENTNQEVLPTIDTSLDNDAITTEIERQGKETWVTYEGPAAASFQILARDDDTYQLDLFIKKKL